MPSRSRLEPYNASARMIRKHPGRILAWTRVRISNGTLEGMNNKLKLASHRSYGFRNDDRYIEAIYHNCGDLSLPPEASSPRQRCAFGRRGENVLGHRPDYGCSRLWPRLNASRSTCSAGLFLGV